MPLTVEEQFLKMDTNNRLSFLLKFYEENKWFKKCQTYHEGVIAILNTNKNIDVGEREAIAQYKQIQLDLEIEDDAIFCILDEQKGRTVALNMNVSHHGTLYLIARLHLAGFFDYKEIDGIKRARRFSDKNIAAALKQAKQDIGIE